MRKVNYKPFSFINIDATNPKQDINKPKPAIEIYIKIFKNHDQVGFILECKDSLTLENQFYHINRIKEKIKSSKT